MTYNVISVAGSWANWPSPSHLDRDATSRSGVGGGIMGALIPLAVPFLLRGDVSAVGLIAALAMSATVVDVSPFSTNGALVLASAQDIDRDRFFKQLMVYGGIMVAAAHRRWCGSPSSSPESGEPSCFPHRIASHPSRAPLRRPHLTHAELDRYPRDTAGSARQ